jgi:glutamyl/glutaminyl-tRNA synthetase
VALQEALGLPTPHYAHIPLIFNPDGSKMSKRDKAKAARAAAKDAGLANVDGVAGDAFADFIGKKSDDLTVTVAVAEHLGLALPEIEVADFRDSGYLPDVLCTYLALLGWNPGGEVDETQITREYLAEHFGLDRVGKSNAKFDRDKLAAFNGEAIRGMSPDEWRAAVWQLPANGPLLQNSGVFSGVDDRSFAAFTEAYRERSTTLRDPLIQGRFFFEAPQEYDLSPKNIAKAVTKGQEGNRGIDYLREFAPQLETLPAANFGTAAHEALQAFCAERELNMGKLAQPIRVAVSGSTVTPPIDATLEILGKDATLARVRPLLAACAM